ncbi:MAG: urocanate hydratase, partial [Tabrizicola sp.]|nr:urocanate hydratase [Tabrizicola sp.]
MQGTYETFNAVAARHFGGSLKGKLCVTAGLGGMGGAQPLAITMADGICLAAEVEEWRAQKRVDTRYLDFIEKDIDKAIDLALEFKSKGENKSIGVICTAVALLKRLKERNIVPDVLTDQTS